MSGSRLGFELGGATRVFRLFSDDRDRAISTPLSLFPFLKKETRDDVIYLIHEFIDIIVAFFRGQLIVAFLQGLLYAIGFSLVGLKYGFVLGLMLGFINIIPYLGSIIGLGIALPLAFFQEGGGTGELVAVLVVFTVVQLIESYFLTPRSWATGRVFTSWPSSWRFSSGEPLWAGSRECSWPYPSPPFLRPCGDSSKRST